MSESTIPFAAMLDQLGNDRTSIEKKLVLLSTIRGESPDATPDLDRHLVCEIGRLKSALELAQKSLAGMKDAIDKVTAPPWIPATYLGSVQTPRGRQALVYLGNSHRLLSVHETVDAELLGVGDEVYLNQEANLLVYRTDPPLRQTGETASFVRRLAGSRMVLRSRDEDIVVTAAATFDVEHVNHGDLVRWDRTSSMVYERIDRDMEDKYRLHDAPVVTRDQLGGLDGHIETLMSTLMAVLVQPELAREFGLSSRQTCFIWGPPGCGKTLLAKYCASEIQRLTGRECHLTIVKPAEWESMYVGETQNNIRRTFEAMRAAANGGFTLLFLDEVESIGRIRGRHYSAYDDKFLASLLAELDGFQSRGDVAVVAASNRKDMIDPALLERLSDVEIAVARPDTRAARAIFSIHLPESLPFAAQNGGASALRTRMIEGAVSRIYAPNGHGPLCTVKFRDGSAREVGPRDLASGRTIEQICRAARQRAFRRACTGGARGLHEEDMHAAVEDTLQRLATALTPHSVRSYVDTLPQDGDVVAVNPAAGRIARKHTYLIPPAESAERN